MVAKSRQYTIEGRLPRWLQSELRARIASAVVLALVAVFVTALGGLLFSAFWLVAGILVLVEWIEMARTEPRPRLRRILSVALSACALAYVLGLGAPGVIAASAIGLGIAAYLAWARRDALWVAFGFAVAAVIALVPPLVRDDPQFGLAGILWLFAVVWATDIAAYFTGRRLGGPKLWPSVSPKKTWSGFAGGLVAGTLGGLLVGVAAESAGAALPYSLAFIASASGIASLASQGGDLAESALKRYFQVKDTSQVIPGHGGVMDRLDGFFAATALLGLALLLSRIGS